MRCYICNRETDNFSKQPDGKWLSICSNCKNIIRDTKRRNYEDIDERDFVDLQLASISFIDFIRFLDRRIKCHSKKNSKTLQTKTD